MGSDTSKPPATSFISMNGGSAAINYGNKDEIEEMRTLIGSIQVVLEQMKKSIKSSRIIPSSLFQSLFNDLESLNIVLNPQRMHICYIVGTTCVGKSSLVNSIVKRKICHVSRIPKAGTLMFEVIPAPEVNTIFVDTIGFGSNTSDSKLLETFKTELQSNGPPDSILLVVTLEQLRNIASLKSTIDYINKVVKRAESMRHNTPVPVICVLNKIDQYFTYESSESEDRTKKIKEHMEEALTIVNQFLKKKANQCIATSTTKNSGIDELRSSINAQSPLNAQTIINDLDCMRKHRWIIADKIIGAFSRASTKVSFLPTVDIFIVIILQEWMYLMLACFSIDATRTLDIFKTAHHTSQDTSLTITTRAFPVGDILQLSLINYAISSNVSVAAAASLTTKLGWTCYNYFADKTHRQCDVFILGETH